MRVPVTGGARARADAPPMMAAADAATFLKPGVSPPKPAKGK